MSLALIGLIGLIGPGLARAQTPGPSGPASTLAHEPFRLYLGMWTTHLNADHLHIDTNNLVGASFHHVFGATFTNSFGKRAYAAGLQTEFAQGQKGPWRAAFGGRVGAISGYDERFLAIAKDTPVLPMVQAFGRVELGRIGAEVSWTFVVVSVTGSVRLGR